MLRVNVGLSRKLSKDYNSTGFSINVDGEVMAPASDAEAVIEQVKQLFDLAEEALDQQIERSSGDSEIASRDAEPPPSIPMPRNGRGKAATNGHSRQPLSENGGGNGNGSSDDAATNKQINYLLSIGKRQRLSTVQLEHRIEEVLGRLVGLYDLTKRDAAKVIDDLTATAASSR